MYRLRGHHLFCLPGYRGMGYSPAYTAAMTRLHTELRTNPQTVIRLVAGPDDLCKHFPTDKPCHCMEQTVWERDERILARLSLQVGQELTWGEIEMKIATRAVAADVSRFCASCPWRSYGVCADGIERIRKGEGLYPVAAESR